jgi:hypothetical protein
VSLHTRCTTTHVVLAESGAKQLRQVCSEVAGYLFCLLLRCLQARSFRLVCMPESFRGLDICCRSWRSIRTAFCHFLSAFVITWGTYVLTIVFCAFFLHVCSVFTFNDIDFIHNPVDVGIHVVQASESHPSRHYASNRCFRGTACFDANEERLQCRPPQVDSRCCRLLK